MTMVNASNLEITSPSAIANLLFISAIVVLVALVLVALLIQPGFARDPQPAKEMKPEREAEVTGDLSSYITYPGAINQ